MTRQSSPVQDQERALSGKQRKQRAFLAGATACVVSLAALLPPERLPSFSCAFRDLTGHSCFTCGLTRSLSAFAHGNLAASAGYHLLGPVLFMGLLGAIVCLGTEALTGRTWKPGTAFWRRALIFCFLVWIAFGGIRLALELA